MQSGILFYCETVDDSCDGVIVEVAVTNHHIAVGPVWELLEVLDDVALPHLLLAEVGVTDHRALHVVSQRAGHEAIHNQDARAVVT